VGIRLAPTYLALAEGRFEGLDLMRHQAQAVDLAEEPRVLIEAPTGGGKTWACAAPLLPALDRGEGAIFAYPTNALADDQQGALLALARRAGRRAAVVTGYAGLSGDPSAHVMIWRLHAGALEEAQESVGGRRRGEVIGRVLERLPDRPLWLVTNPDTLFLLLTARYSLAPQLWSRLQPCRTLVLDESHLYRGPTLVRALTAIELAHALLGVARVRIATATLPPLVRQLLVNRFGFTPIEAVVAASGRCVQHEVELQMLPTTRDAATGHFVDAIVPLLPELRSERTRGRVPLVALRDSVVSAIHLEDELVCRGASHAELGIYRGLSSRTIRDMDAKTLVLGTSALEVGVDFNTSRLVFEARGATSFLQRLGRVGRHGSGWAQYVTDARVASALSTLPDPCPREELRRRVVDVLVGDDSLAGFSSSRLGALVGAASLGALRSRAAKLGAPDAFQELVNDVEATLCEALDWPVAEPRYGLSRKAFRRLSESVGFRGGSTSVEVLDVQEARRRGNDDLARYDVDWKFLAERAQVRRTAGDRVVVISYGAARRVALELQMGSPLRLGEFCAPDPDQIQVRIDGVPSPLEEHLRARPPLVGIFPQTLRGRLSWREDVIEFADGRIALLDDDALVGAYLYERDA
jgi:hypothetical protein